MTVELCTPKNNTYFSNVFFVTLNTALVLIFICCRQKFVVAKLSTLHIARNYLPLYSGKYAPY
jgi:hypothetical protein